MVKVVKIDGEDVVCTIREEHDKMILINPVRFLPTQDGLGMMAWCPFSNQKEYEIVKGRILFIVDASPEIANAYNSQFGGIVTPSPRLN